MQITWDVTQHMKDLESAGVKPEDLIGMEIRDKTCGNVLIGFVTAVKGDHFVGEVAQLPGYPKISSSMEINVK